MSFMNILNKPKDTDDGDLKDYENPDHFRDKQDTLGNIPSSEEMEMLLSGVGSNVKEYDPQDVANGNNQETSGNTPHIHLTLNNSVPSSQAQERIYKKEEWENDDTDFEDSVQGTMFQQPQQGFHSPQITFASPISKPQMSQQKNDNSPASPPPSFNSVPLQQQTPSQTFSPPPDLSKQAETQQNMQMPYQPIPQEQSLNFSPSISDFSDDAEDEDKSPLSSDNSQNIGLLGKIKEFINKKKSNKKPKPPKTKPKKNKDTNIDEQKVETDPKKYALLVLLLFVLAGVGYFVFSMIAPGLFATNNGAQPNKNNNQKKKVATILVEDRSGNIPQNPFVAKSQVAALAIVEGVYPKKVQGNQPVVAGSHPVAVPQNVPRFTPPTIPKSSPAPSVSRMIPAVPKGSMSAPPQQSATSSAPKLTGIIESDEGAVAVMSDGTVVSSGDTYTDGRIAYIGGDGIHFDNGKTITFEE